MAGFHFNRIGIISARYFAEPQNAQDAKLPAPVIFMMADGMVVGK